MISWGLGMSFNFKKYLLIFLVFCRPIFGDDLCSYQNLKTDEVRAIRKEISEVMRRTILNYLNERNIELNEEIYIPVRIFEEWVINLYPETFISTSFSLITKKNQTICHSKNNIECEFNEKFPLFFNLNLERDNEGIPIKKTCEVYSTIVMNIVNITQNYKLEGLIIFGGYNNPIHKWEIPVSKADEYSF